MMQPIDIIQLGASGALFQVRDGERFGIVEFEEWDGQDHRAQMSHPNSQAFLSQWLQEKGALIGSQNPPYLEWRHVKLALVAARV